jgi:aspartate/methionine/tyrosine aminotransferase
VYPRAGDLREENDFRLDINELKAKITSKTKLIILNSPSNPTGSALTRSDLEALRVFLWQPAVIRNVNG